MTRLRLLPASALFLLALGACQPDAKKPAPSPVAEQAGKAEAEEAEKPAPKKAANANEPDPVPANVFAKVDGKDVDIAVITERFELKIGRIPEEKRTRIQRQRWLRKVTEDVVWQTAYQTAVDKAGLKIDRSEVDKDLAEFKSKPEVFASYLEKNAENEASYLAKQVHRLNEQALLAARGLAKPTEAEAREWYEQNKDKFKRDVETIRASHFLVAEGPREGNTRVEPITREDREKASPETLKKWHDDAIAYAEYLRKEVMKPGVDFNEFTFEHSEGPGRQRKGDMGVFPKTQMVPKYSEAAFALKVGEVSEVVETSKGIYVIKVFGRYAPGILPFEAIKKELMQQLEGMRYQDARQALRQELMTSMAIDFGMKEAGASTTTVKDGDGAADAPSSQK